MAHQPPPGYSATAPPGGYVAPPSAAAPAPARPPAPAPAAAAGGNANALGKPEDVVEVELALATKIPAWSQRLATALGKPMAFFIDFNKLTSSCPDQPTKLRVIKAAVSGSPAALGLLTSPAAAETLVRAIEKSCTFDAGATAAMAAAINQVEVRSLPTGEPKRMILEAGVLIYAGSFQDKKLITDKEIKDFLEDKFYVRERQLVTRFQQGTLPAARARLANALPQTALSFDVVAILSQIEAKAPGKRLGAARTMISQAGLARTLGQASRTAEYEGTKLATKATVAATEAFVAASDSASDGTDGQKKQAPARPPPPAATAPAAKPEMDVFDSPNVVAPLLAAVEAVCANADNKAAVSTAIREIRVVEAADAAPVSLQLLDGSGAALQPSATGAPGCQGGVMLYTARFEDGASGCLGKADVLDFFEQHFRAQEKTLVHTFLAQTLPELNGRLQQLISPQVEVEMAWATVFTPDLQPGDARLERAKQLIRATTLHKVVQALEQIAAADLSGQAKVIMAQRIGRVAVQCAADPKAKATITLTDGATGVGGPSVLVYTTVLQRGERGCLAVHEAKAQIRALLGIATPESEKGVNAALNKVSAEASRALQDGSKLLSKGLSSLGWGKKKK